MDEALFWVTAGTFLLVGSLGLLVRARLEHVAAMSWPTTQGRLVNAAVKRVHDNDGDYFLVRLLYRYRVDGRAHEGRRIAFGPEKRYGTEAKAQRALAGFDQTPVVHYDPRRPEASVLHPKLSGGEYIFMACMGLFLLVGGAMEKAGAAP